jgi:hypothetical protein
LSAAGEFIVVDTGVFSDGLSPSRDDLGVVYAKDLHGKRMLISFQTAAEVRYGGLKRGWGQRRLSLMEHRLSSAVEVPPHTELTIEWATLRNDCRTAGHAFQDRRHTADLWIAATARLIDAPLITHDSAFRGLPGLTVICHA